MTAVRIATLSWLLVAGSAFAADKPPCGLLARPEVQAVAGAGAVKAQYIHQELPQRGPKGLTPIHICNWSVQETQSAVEVWVVAAPMDAKVQSAALTTLGVHGKQLEEDAQQFGDIACWTEALPQKLLPNSVCIGAVKGNVLKVLPKSRTAKPTTPQAKALFDEAAAGL